MDKNRFCEKTYECNLGLAGENPVLLELAVSKHFLFAAFQMDSPSATLKKGKESSQSRESL